jgi:hypothetical protein
VPERPEDRLVKATRNVIARIERNRATAEQIRKDRAAREAEQARQPSIPPTSRG